MNFIKRLFGAKKDEYNELTHRIRMMLESGIEYRIESHNTYEGTLMFRNTYIYLGNVEFIREEFLGLRGFQGCYYKLKIDGMPVSRDKDYIRPTFNYVIEMEELKGEKKLNDFLHIKSK